MDDAETRVNSFHQVIDMFRDLFDGFDAAIASQVAENGMAPVRREGLAGIQQSALATVRGRAEMKARALVAAKGNPQASADFVDIAIALYEFLSLLDTLISWLWEHVPPEQRTQLPRHIALSRHNPHATRANRTRFAAAMSELYDSLSGEQKREIDRAVEEGIENDLAVFDITVRYEALRSALFRSGRMTAKHEFEITGAAGGKA